MLNPVTSTLAVNKTALTQQSDYWKCWKGSKYLRCLCSKAGYSLCSPCCRMETSGLSWLITLCNEHRSQKGIFYDLGRDPLIFVRSKGCPCTRDTLGGFRCTEGELQSITALSHSCPEECSSSWADKVTLKKLGICLVLDKFHPLPWEVVHTRPRGQGSKAFAGMREGSVCLWIPASSMFPVPATLAPRENLTLSSETPSFSPQRPWHSAAIPLELTGQIQELGNDRFRCSEAVPSVVQTHVEVCNEGKLGEQIRKMQNIC